MIVSLYFYEHLSCDILISKLLLKLASSLWSPKPIKETILHLLAVEILYGRHRKVLKSLMDGQLLRRRWSVVITIPTKSSCWDLNKVSLAVLWFFKFESFDFHLIHLCQIELHLLNLALAESECKSSKLLHNKLNESENKHKKIPHNHLKALKIRNVRFDLASWCVGGDQKAVIHSRDCCWIKRSIEVNLSWHKF